ncbi:MAG: dihydrodipicolinate synthase family protein [Acidobacteria bacterium]|nr:dihydrodipicolinate synthase family protein [Acidobacteriota bacterium]
MSLGIGELKSTLKGIIGFGVTPFHKDLSVNVDALRQNASFLAKHCEVVVPLAGNGEIYSVSPEEHKMIARTVVEEVQGRKPVVVGIGYSVPIACEMAQAAEAYGADGVLILPPYFTSANDDGLFDYYRSIARATKLGALLFQTHAMNFSISLLRRLAEIPNIVGMKDEHGDMHQFVRQWGAVGDRLELLCGVGEILAPSYFALGVKAFTSGLVNFMPETCRRILKHLQEGKLESAARLVEKETIPIFNLRKKRPGYVTLIVKEAMNLCGMNAGPVRPPLAPLPANDFEELRNVLASLGLLKREALKL